MLSQKARMSLSQTGTLHALAGTGASQRNASQTHNHTECNANPFIRYDGIALAGHVVEDTSAFHYYSRHASLFRRVNCE
ncbi:hypothetical protein DM02DRAFT_52713 [Periconia macrospinosa]|uniref:Uncharacterized protein n=1 Tax=Periconia macrospinosa TaxID=97972 RepID=A0A2V1DJ63_9PLEO|nr:hypothetical protein DM02DRAFT_52713 [Periconia macrospinosa]